MIAIQERHFTVRFDPDLLNDWDIVLNEMVVTVAHLILGILRQVVQRGDVQLELPRLRELAETCAKADKVRSRNRDSEPHGRLRDIVYSVSMKSEAVWFVGTVDEMDEVFALQGEG